MTLSNRLTLSRFVLAFVMTMFLTVPGIPFGKTFGLLVFLVAALTDYWDGRLARENSNITAFGQLMDPLADKVLVCAAFVSFVSWNQIVPSWIVVTILTREFLVTGLRLIAANRGIVLPADRWGKHKTIWQIIVIIAIIFGKACRDDLLPALLNEKDLVLFLSAYYDKIFDVLTYILSAMAALLTLISGTIYFIHNRKLVMEEI